MAHVGSKALKSQYEKIVIQKINENMCLLFCNLKNVKHCINNNYNITHQLH